jgi:hypothetical protein
LDKVKEIIVQPEFEGGILNQQQRPDKVQISPEATEQLRDYVTCIASMHRATSFHNFEHASHVSCQANCLLDSDKGQAATLHDHTYSIASDPLIHFACAFSAPSAMLVTRIASNAQLVKEDVPVAVAVAYNNRSVAEQISLALAWDLLTDGRFKDLRSTLCVNFGELQRFCQLAVNAVMATAIVDKDLKALCNGRWEKAFFTVQEQTMLDHPRDVINRKATIVTEEHLIQASELLTRCNIGISPCKWNDRYYVAFVHGRAESDPSKAGTREKWVFRVLHIIDQKAEKVWWLLEER